MKKFILELTNEQMNVLFKAILNAGYHLYDDKKKIKLYNDINELGQQIVNDFYLQEHKYKEYLHKKEKSLITIFDLGIEL